MRGLWHALLASIGNSDVGLYGIARSFGVYALVGNADFGRGMVV